jgi:23S rRNA pseudouridine1911/1915/1917 synthase
MAEALPAFSRTQAQRLIEQGHVSVDGAAATRAAYAVEAGTLVEVTFPEAVEPVDAAATPLTVLYEDEHTLVIDKPAGIIVHAVTGSPAALRTPRAGGTTLVDVVRAHYPDADDLQEGDYRAGVVHRLDRDTTGVLAFAKTDVARDTLKDQWRARETLKEYVAIVEGQVEPPAGIIEADLGPDPNDPRRRAVVESGEHAYTEYSVREQYGNEAALLDVVIRTGRTHQIRVHLEAIGHAVIGDRLYGRPSPLIGRQALHAARLGFRLPSTDEWREFEAPSRTICVRPSRSCASGTASARSTQVGLARDDRTRALRTQPHRGPARRQHPHGALDIPARETARRSVPRPHRRHRPGA